MSFLKERVHNVVCHPPPGHYESNHLHVTMSTETANAKIILTTDGSEPIENSDKSHGFSCTHYSPLKGLELKGGGKHMLTIVALKEGCVPTRPVTVTYHLSGPKASGHSVRGQDRNIEHEFDLSTRFTPAVTVQQQRKQFGSGNVTCVLRDVCPKDTIRSHMAQGKRLNLYRLKFNDHVVSRSIVYERVATPNMDMTMPVLPYRDDSAAKGAAVDLRNTAVRCVTPAVYEHSNLLLSSCTAVDVFRPATPLSPTRLNTTMEGARRVTSPTAFHHPYLNTSLNSSIYEDVKRKVLPALTPDSGQASRGQLKTVSTALSLFEVRHNLGVIKPDGVQEASDKAEEEAYLVQCDALVKEEVKRVGRISKTFSRMFAGAAQVAGKQSKNGVVSGGGRIVDVAESEREPMTLFVIGEEICRSAFLRKILSVNHYNELHKKLNGLQLATASEIASLSKGCVTADECARTLAPLAQKSSEGGGVTKYPTKILLCFFRYVVCLAQPIPEAPLFLFVSLCKNVVDAKGEGPVGRVGLMSAIDLYRRTRGANPVALAQLQDMYYTGLEFSKEGSLTVQMLLDYITSNIPLVDAAFERMGDIEQEMFRRTLSL